MLCFIHVFHVFFVCCIVYVGDRKYRALQQVPGLTRVKPLTDYFKLIVMHTMGVVISYYLLILIYSVATVC